MAKPHQRTKSNVLFFLAGALVWALGACSSEPQHDDGSGDFTRQKITSISFAEVNAKVFTPQCVECHSRYSDYAAVKLELQDILSAVRSGRMPKGKSKLSPEDKKTLVDWGLAGAPFDPVQEAPKEIELAPYWESISKRIFQPHCVACHSPDGEVPWVDFTTYESVTAMKAELFNVEKPRDSYLIEVVLDPEEPMPPLESNVRSLSQAQIRVLLDWIGKDLPKK